MPADYGYGAYDRQRLHETHAAEDDRTPFARDVDRLLYNPAFRRLQGKTQVVTPGEADFFRTRLTHTLEVTQVARRLAEQLNARLLDLRENGRLADWDAGLAEFDAPDGVVDPDVCAAAAMLHDLGHPPFGHAGEEALAEAVPRLLEHEDCIWEVADHGSFDGNAQSFRLAAHALPHRRPGNGLELTRAVLDGCLKYPWFHAEGVEKWSVFRLEQPAFEIVRQDVPEALMTVQTIEAQIMDWADDVAYSVHDVDDWTLAGFMPIFALVSSTDRAEELAAAVKRRWAERDRAFSPEDVDAQVFDLFTNAEGAFGPLIRRARAGEKLDAGAWETQDAMRVARSVLFGEFMSAVRLVVRPDSAGAPSHRYRLLLDIDAVSKLRCDILREMLPIYVLGSQRMATHQVGQRRVVAELLEIFACAAWKGTDTALAVFPGYTRDELRDGREHHMRSLRLVVDHVAAMSDSYALRTHARLTGQQTPFNQFV